MSPRNRRLPSNMEHRFSEVPRVSIPRSRFNRSFTVKTTFDAGLLIPIYVDEALPGDTFKLRMTAFGRLATPIVPIMDNLYLETFFFAVPNRLLWSNWEKFNGAQDDPGDSTDFTVPRLDSTAVAEATIYDYMGLPLGMSTGTHRVQALPFRAYNLIYNEWFRDQNLQDSVAVELGDGPDAVADYEILRRGKRHDYFTSCLPFPQKGPAVTLPIGSSAPVDPDGATGPTFQNFGATQDDAVLFADSSASSSGISAGPGTGTWTANDQLFWDNPGLVADLSSATATSINELRQAFQVQRMLEKDARGGTRYTEVILSHFGVRSPDARMDRPEYLGGGRTSINVSPVQQTSETDSGTPQGNLAAYATTSFTNHGFTMSFTEHCVVLGLVCVRADLTYQQGLRRMWSRETRYDFYWPSLAHLGEQAVLNKEIWTDNGGADDQVFGYQEAFADYRYFPSLITGLFRSDAAGSLDVWHLSQDFATRPALNAEFIEEDPPIDRVVATPDEPHMLLDTFTNLVCARPMPVYGVPGLIDHF